MLKYNTFEDAKRKADQLNEIQKDPPTAFTGKTVLVFEGEEHELKSIRINHKPTGETKPMAKKSNPQMTPVTGPVPNAHDQREANMAQVHATDVQDQDANADQNQEQDPTPSSPAAPSPDEIKIQVSERLSRYESIEQEKLNLLNQLDSLDQEQSQVVGEIFKLRGPGRLKWQRPDGTWVTAKIRERRLQPGRGEDAGRPFPGGPRYSFSFDNEASVETF